MSEITREGADLVQRWKNATARVKELKSQLNSAECEASNSANALKNWLVPADFKTGEKFCVVLERDFVQVEILPYDNCTLTIRPRNK